MHYKRVMLFSATGSAPWYSEIWTDKSHVNDVWELKSGQANVVIDDEITNMNSMFNGCSNLTSLDLFTHFNTSKVTNMRNVFCNCYNLTELDLSAFNTSKVTSMNSMFYNCPGLTSIDLSSFNTSNVTSMEHMFYGCNGLTTLDLSNFDTSNVTDMHGMFINCSNLTTIKGVIDMKSCEDWYDMFLNCPKLKGVNIKNPPDGFESISGLSKSQYTIVDNEADSLKSKNIMKTQVFVSKGNSPWFNPIWWTDKEHAINTDKSTFNQATVTCDGNVTNMRSMFNACDNLTTIDLSNFDTSKVVNMSYMFYNCPNLTTLDLSSFDTSKVNNMRYMFEACSSLTTLDITNFDTSKVTDMGWMFADCISLTTIKGVIDMKSCKHYKGMFVGCPRLTNVKIKNPPSDFESETGISSFQYTIVDDESDSLKRRNNMFRSTGIEPIIDIPIDIYKVPGGSSETIITTNYIPSDTNNDAPKYDKATQEVDDKKEEAMSDFNKSVKELSNKLDEIVNKNTEESSPKKEEVSKETKEEEHKPTNEEKVQKAIDDEEINKEKIYNVLKNFIYESDFIPAFLWFMEHAYNNVSFAHQHKRRVYKIYKEIIKGGNLFGKCIGDISDEQGNCAFFMNGSDRAMKDFQYNRQAKAAKLLAKFIIASNTTPYVLDLISYYEDSDMDCYTAIPTAISDIRMVYKSELYVKTLEKVCFGRDF